MSIYEENGYKSRKNYLECLAEDKQVDVYIVFNLANLLGKEEDFDGLIAVLEDI